MSNDKLTKQEAELRATEQKLEAVENDEKYYLREIQDLIRKERTHQLCIRAGMLEVFLKEPNLLNDDVIELSQIIFHSEASQENWNCLLRNGAKRLKVEQAKTLGKRQGRNYISL